MKLPRVRPEFDVVPTYKGGPTVVMKSGYVFEFLPKHPRRNFWGFVPQHRLVAEDMIGRPLATNEVVHHIDENPGNNHPSNLQVMESREHWKLHAVKRAEAQKSLLKEADVRAALEKYKNLKRAAKHMRCNHQTLRNRFPELVAPYKRRSPTRIDDPKAIAIVLRYAPDPAYQLDDVVRMTGMSAMTVLRICRRNGVTWVKKSRRGEIHRTYRGKPTPRCIAACDQGTGLGSPPKPHD